MPAGRPGHIVECDLLAERTKAGLEAARRQGRVGGRPQALSSAGGAEATRMYREGQTVIHIATALRVSRATIHLRTEALNSSAP